jgi:hypothetical protein
MSDWILDILFNIQTETRYLVKYPGYPPSNINTEIHSKKISSGLIFLNIRLDTRYLVKYLIYPATVYPYNRNLVSCQMPYIRSKDI